jgi:hypothetical protein
VKTFLVVAARKHTIDLPAVDVLDVRTWLR